MKTKFLIICVLSVFNWKSAKLQIVVQVVDIKTFVSLSFATVTSLKTGNQWIANDSGKVIIHHFVDDTLKVTHIGYKPSLNLSPFDTIFLTRVDSVLPKVLISSKKFVQRIRLSDEKFNLRDKLRDPHALILAEIAQQFTVPEFSGTYKIKSIYIPVAKSSCWQDLVLRVYTSSEKSDSLPDKEIFVKRFPLKNKMVQKGKAVFNVAAENLNFSSNEKFYISVTLDTTRKNNCRTLIFLEKTSRPNHVNRCNSCISRFPDGSLVPNDSLWNRNPKFYTNGSPTITWDEQMFGEVELERYR